MSQNAIINLILPMTGLPDQEVLDLVSGFVATCPVDTSVWGPWMSPVVTKLNPGKRWTRPWPTDPVGRREILLSSWSMDDNDERIPDRGVRISLVRRLHAKEHDTSTDWSLDARLGYPRGGLDWILVTIPSAEEPFGVDAETLRTVFEFMTDYWQPEWATLRHIDLPLWKPDEPQNTGWQEGKTYPAWITYFSRGEAERRGVESLELDGIADLTERPGGIQAQVPGGFAHTDVAAAHRLADLTLPPEAAPGR